MHVVLKQIEAIGLVPVVKIDRVEDAVPLAKALCEGGLACAEVTFRTDAAEGAIRAMAQAYPNMLLGAGTVLTTNQADRAMAAGAKFIVSPGLNPKVVSHCVEKGYPITPGTSSPSDVEQALELGLEVVKFFPAEAAGGLAMIKAMAAPYTTVKFMPTGGINAKNLTSYLDFPRIIACGGSWMVSDELLREGQFDRIKVLTQQAVQTMLGFELAHVGFNCPDSQTATEHAGQLETLFGFPSKEGTGSIFSSSGIELMKQPYLGEKGHVAIRTNYIHRAVHYLTSQGVNFDWDAAKYDDQGKLIAVYLKDQLGGFAFHLVQKA